MDATNPSYPTRCLRFLQLLHGKKRESPSPAKISLKIVICGAGLGGLSTAIALARRGHDVTALEQVPQLAEVGAGIQIPPNSARLLVDWGVIQHLESQLVEPSAIAFRRWQSGEVIGLTKLLPNFRKTFDAPYYVVHRAHFHEALYRRAVGLGVKVQFDARVVEYDDVNGTVILEDGRIWSADLIVAADGVKSIARKLVLGGKDVSPRLAGFAAYRATVDVARLSADDDTSWLVKNPGINCWIGDMRHVMTYMIAGGDSFNMVLSHPENSDPSTWNQDRAVEDMKKHFVGWDRRLLKIINMIEQTQKWPLLSMEPLERWVSESGNLVILGDSAHPMLPYMSEGAAMAVEDGAALAEMLSRLESKEELKLGLTAFEKVRLKRTSQMQQASLINGKIWHFPDGPEQQARDESMKAEVEGLSFSESPNQWSDPVTADWCYGYDAEKEMANAWEILRQRRWRL